MIDGVLINSLPIIQVNGGNVLHFIKNEDIGFKKFGECYFSEINFKHIKGWKKHKSVTLNITVPKGEIKFVIYDDRKKSKSFGVFQEIIIGDQNYKRLTVPPLLWVAFQGVVKGRSILVNIIDKKHDPTESENVKINSFDYKWECE